MVYLKNVEWVPLNWVQSDGLMWELNFSGAALLMLTLYWNECLDWCKNNVFITYVKGVKFQLVLPKTAAH